MKLGLQMWSVRNSFEKDPRGTLERIAEIGYTDLQVNSFQITPEGMTFGKDVSAEDLRKTLDEVGLKAVSAHFIPTPDMRIETIAEDLHVLGVTTIADAAHFWSTPEEVRAWNYQFNLYGEAFKKQGIQLYYHNHFHEFQVFGDKTILDMILEGTDKDNVKIELDTFWAVRGGQDPIAWLKRLGSRCDLIHQKDLPANPANPVNLFHEFGYDINYKMEVLWQIQDANDFAEVGEGVLNISDYIQAARKYNDAEYIFVEQDMTSKTEMESIRVSFANINKLLAEN